jgi:hypothetical protein
VAAAAEIQRRLGARNDQLADHRRMETRIGINIGDVLHEDGALYGDGVNVAARLEALADPSSLAGLDENDPRSIGRWMRKMSAEMGEDLGDEFDEMVDRLEAGESPEDIEAAMPDLGGADFGGDDLMD